MNVIEIASQALLSFRFAPRRLLAAPVFTMFGIGSLLVSVSLATSATSLIAGVLWPPTGVRSTETLWLVETIDINAGRRWRNAFGFGHYREARAATQDLEVVAVLEVDRPFAQSNRNLLLRGEAVFGPYFAALGLKPALGRLLDQVDESASSGNNIVVSERFWRSTLASTPDVVGTSLKIDGQVVTVVGVVSKEFPGIRRLFQPVLTDFWVSGYSPFVGRVDDTERVTLISRQTASQDDARSVVAALAARQSDTGGNVSVRSLAEVKGEENWRKMPATVAALMVVAILFLIACTNLAAMTLGRSLQRASLIRIQRQLGASRARVVTELASELCLIAAIGVAASLPIGRIASEIMVEAFTVRGVPLASWVTPVFGGWELALTAGTLVVLITVAGLMPALKMSFATDPAQSGPAGSESLGRIPKTSRNRLITMQVAVCGTLLLAAAAGITIVEARGQHDYGIDVDSLAVARLAVESREWSKDRENLVLSHLRAFVHSDPRIEGVALSTGFHFGVSATPLGMVGDFLTTGEKLDQGGLGVKLVSSTPNLFDVIGLSVVEGRAFTQIESETGSSVAVLSDAVARGLFGRDSAIGRDLRIQGLSGPVRVVGVADDATDGSASSDTLHAVYLPRGLRGDPPNVIVVRANPPLYGVGALESGLQGVQNLPVTSVGTGRAVLLGNVAGIQQAAAALGLLGLLGAGLALAGLFGSLSQQVSFRMREFGIRLSIGASAKQILFGVLRDGVQPVAVGVCLALIVGGIIRVSAGIEFSVPFKILDLLLIGLFVLASLLAALAASAVPAFRAARANPSALLRSL